MKRKRTFAAEARRIIKKYEGLTSSWDKKAMEEELKTLAEAQEKAKAMAEAQMQQQQPQQQFAFGGSMYTDLISNMLTGDPPTGKPGRGTKADTVGTLKGDILKEDGVSGVLSQEDIDRINYFNSAYKNKSAGFQAALNSEGLSYMQRVLDKKREFDNSRYAYDLGKYGPDSIERDPETGYERVLKGAGIFDYADDGSVMWGKKASKYTKDDKVLYLKKLREMTGNPELNVKEYAYGTSKLDNSSKPKPKSDKEIFKALKQVADILGVEYNPDTGEKPVEGTEEKGTKASKKALDTVKKYLGDNADTLIGGGASIAANLLSRRNLEKPEFVEPQRINPNPYIPNYDLLGELASIDNEARSAMYNLTDKGGDFGSYSDAVSKLNFASSAAKNTARKEYQKDLFEKYKFVSNMMHDADVRNTSAYNANRMKYTDDKIAYADKQNVYTSAIGQTVMNMLKEIQDRKQAEELGPILERIAQLTGQTQN